MTDTELIKLIAKIWVENGGDVEGIDYCYRRIKDEINKLKPPRKELEWRGREEVVVKNVVIWIIKMSTIFGVKLYPKMSKEEI